MDAGLDSDEAASFDADCKDLTKLLKRLYTQPNSSGCAGVVQLLLENGHTADIAAITPLQEGMHGQPAKRIGMTPLHLAACCGWEGRCQGFGIGGSSGGSSNGDGNAGGSSRDADTAGTTAAAEPVSYSDKAAVWELCGVAAQRDSTAGREQARIVQLLVQHGVDPNKLPGNQDAPLTLAAVCGATAAALALIDCGADVNLPRTDGVR